jgi:hypothetical protein
MERMPRLHKIGARCAECHDDSTATRARLDSSGTGRVLQDLRNDFNITWAMWIVRIGIDL